MPFTQSSITVKSVFTQGTFWSLQHPLVYRGKKDIWCVPRGYVTDFASVPLILRWLIGVSGLYTKAAILHDWFCEIGIKKGKVSARDADAVFRRVMREEKVDYATRWLMWCAVRWGALFNPVRRAGWWRDLPLILLISLPSLIIVVPGVVGAVFGLLAWTILRFVVAMIGAIRVLVLRRR